MNLNLDIRRTLALFIGVCHAGTYTTLRAIQETTGDDTVLVQTHDGRTVWKASDAVPRMHEVLRSQQRLIAAAQEMLDLPDDQLVDYCRSQNGEPWLSKVVRGIGRTIGDGWNPRTTGLETPSVKHWDLFVHAKQLLWKLEELVGLAAGEISGTTVWFTNEANLPAGLNPEERYVATILDDGRFQIDTDDGRRIRVPASEPHYTTPVAR